MLFEAVLRVRRKGVTSEERASNVESEQGQEQWEREQWWLTRRSRGSRVCAQNLAELPRAADTLFCCTFTFLLKTIFLDISTLSKVRKP